MELDRVRKVIQESSRIVCILGKRVSLDTGCDFNGGDEVSYEMEEKYGQSPEEIFSTAFFNNRPKAFFNYYREEILKKRGEPNECHTTLAKMEADGKLSAIITYGFFNLAERGGCRNVIRLYGNIYKNHCPHCGRTYDIDYILKSDGVPYCEDCNTMIRPDVCLHGDMMDIDKVTRAAEAVSNADTLLVLGCNMNARITREAMSKFRGNHVILIHDEPHYLDGQADIRVIGSPKDVLPEIYR